MEALHLACSPSLLPPPPTHPHRLQNSSLVAVYKKHSSEKLQRIATTYEAPASLLQQQ